MPYVDSALYIGWTTFQDKPDDFARVLVERGLCQCAQIDGPITSCYKWGGKVECAREWRLTLKFLGRHGEAVETWMHAHHPYACPEWVVIAADRVGDKYQKWLNESSGA